jgi:hypothetical protein
MNALDPVSDVRRLTQSAAVLCFPPIAHVAASHGTHSPARIDLGSWPLSAGLGLIAVIAVLLIVSRRTGPKRASRLAMSFAGGITP